MLKLGIIGTNWITQQFVEAAISSGQYQLAAVFSRHAATAEAFIEKTRPAKAYTVLDEFLASDCDVIYIASPNSLHAQQTIAAVNAGKHVIVEKPMVTHPSQLQALQAALAAHPQVMVFEAARHLYDPNFKVVSDYLLTHSVTGASLTYMKYSSRYDAYLAGEQPNIFSPRFAGGALMDLGIYLVYAAVAWFGVPKHVTYLPHLLASGVDGDGVAQLTYGDFDVVLRTGKTTNSEAQSEVYFGRDTVAFDSPGEFTALRLTTAKGTEDLWQPHAANPMVEEATYFAKALQTNDRAAFEQKWALAQQVHAVMGELRASAGIRFDDDPE
ncbi:MAG: Gfo/Idh/MocA family oxidoreductase [Lactobacillus sp.]|jgi:predicted dehydrogenase|nr:Gfo/Idh/MocA family oxidoreductase [Lactobacillus sp.]MCI2032937.1 Gfo/Idh/MocA family oxidoreductase [Lactobacillus sp.]